MDGPDVGRQRARQALGADKPQRAEQVLATLTAQRRRIESLALSPDGARVATGASDGSVWVWRWREGGPDWLLWVGAFALGLGLGNHLTLVFVVPAALVLLWPERRRWFRARVLLPAAALD